MRNVLRRFSVGGSGWTLAFVAVLATTIAACNVLSIADKPRGPDAFDNIRDTDLTPRFPREAEPAVSDRRDGTRPATYYGTVAAAPATGAQPAARGEGSDLILKTTPTATVPKVTLGNFLGAGYTTATRVKETVT